MKIWGLTVSGAINVARNGLGPTYISTGMYPENILRADIHLIKNTPDLLNLPHYILGIFHIARELIMRGTPHTLVRTVPSSGYTAWPRPLRGTGLIPQFHLSMYIRVCILIFITPGLPCISIYYCLGPRRRCDTEIKVLVHVVVILEPWKLNPLTELRVPTSICSWAKQMRVRMRLRMQMLRR